MEGKAALRAGSAGDSRGAAEAAARRFSLGVMLRAREDRSLEGVLAAAESFARLGDRQVVDVSIRIAEGLAARAGGPEPIP